MTAVPASLAGICKVPGCKEAGGAEDCCAAHSRGQARSGCLPNDGVIDWLAVELAAQGAREVSLTWVETDIAAAAMIADGYGVKAVEKRLGVCLQKPVRREAIRRMAEAVAREGLGA